MKFLLILQLIIILGLVLVSPMSPFGRYFYFDVLVRDGDSYLLNHKDDSVNIYVEDGKLSLSTVTDSPLNLSFVKYDSNDSKLIVYHRIDDVLTSFSDNDSDGIFDTKTVVSPTKSELFELKEIEWEIKKSKSKN